MLYVVSWIPVLVILFGYAPDPLLNADQFLLQDIQSGFPMFVRDQEVLFPVSP